MNLPTTLRSSSKAKRPSSKKNNIWNKQANIQKKVTKKETKNLKNKKDTKTNKKAIIPIKNKCTLSKLLSRKAAMDPRARISLRKRSLWESSKKTLLKRIEPPMSSELPPKAKNFSYSFPRRK